MNDLTEKRLIRIMKKNGCLFVSESIRSGVYSFHRKWKNARKKGLVWRRIGENLMADFNG